MRQRSPTMIPNLSMSPDLARWLIALVGALVIAGAAYHLRALNASGMIAAIILGTTIAGGAGWWSGLLLIAFFVSASILSRIGRDTTVVSTARGSRRDAVQVFANGGIALVCAVGYVITGHPAWLLAVAGSLAAASADTWSTEVGRTSPAPPRLVTTGKRVPAGTSGAISGRGLAAALSGAFFIGALAATGVAINAIDMSAEWFIVLIAIALAGFAGALLDSILGATLQEQRWCERCEKQTERTIHHCGAPTAPAGGVTWITNDVVNAACVITGGSLAAGIGLLFG